MFGVHVFGGPYFGQGPPGIAEPPPVVDFIFAVDVVVRPSSEAVDVVIGLSSMATDVLVRPSARAVDVKVTS